MCRSPRRSAAYAVVTRAPEISLVPPMRSLRPARRYPPQRAGKRALSSRLVRANERRGIRKMRTRLAIVLILISGTLAGVFGANILAGSSTTLTTGTTQTRVMTLRLHGRVSAHRRSRNFFISVPATAAVEARLRWGNDHAHLREGL